MKSLSKSFLAPFDLGEIVHQKLVDQNNETKIIKDFKLIVEKRVELTHKKIKQQKINQ